MRNHETGEFELVVGNKQLLSGFFIVALLFAVAFAMGYVVGENTRATKAQAEAPVVPPPATAADARPAPSSPAPAAPVPAPTETPTPTQPASEAPPQPTTQPAQETPSQPAPAPLPTMTTSVPTPEAEAGKYWQVIATANKDSAQTLLQTLRDKGFPASLSPGPNNLTRVLVGPYTDTASMGRAKTELESAGFSRLVRH